MNNILIYPTFVGRLGNNLFQIAACIGYAKENHCGWGVRKGYHDHGFGMFQVDKFFPHLPECHHQFRAYNEPYFYHQRIPWHTNGVRIVGFWQSLKYFIDAQDEVKKWLRLDYQKGYEGYTSIHVRLGDYVQHSGSFPPITHEYVRKAIEHFPDGKFMVFSDDIKAVKRLFANDLYDFTFEYSEGRNEFEDMSVMASCGNHIISNSTLAWWSAYLGQNPDKKVVSPHHLNWFGINNPFRFDTFDLLPEEWIKIKFR